MTSSTSKLYKDSGNDDKEKTSSSNADQRQHLFEAIRNGDEAAFAEYYYGFVDSLVNFLAKLLGGQEEAKEVAQEVFIKLWETRDNIDPTQKLNSFVYTTARNMAFNIIRKRGTHSKYIHEQIASGHDAYSAADENLISKETELLIGLIVNSMPPQRRKVFIMSRTEGLTYEEIARLMGISLDTVKTHMKLALKDLKEALAIFILYLLFS